MSNLRVKTARRVSCLIALLSLAASLTLIGYARVERTAAASQGRALSATHQRRQQINESLAARSLAANAVTSPYLLHPFVQHGLRRALAADVLSFGASLSLRAIAPAFQTSGKIAFTSTRDGHFEIYSMDADGTNQVRLTNSVQGSYGPVWSPDGAKIAFTSLQGANAEVRVMDADGAHQTALASGTASNLSPAWSPDGAKVAFVTNRDGNYEIYSMNADGSSPTRLTTNTSGDFNPAWTVGGRIAFVSNRDASDEIYSMNADGTQQVRLTTDAAFDFDPVYSPDGTKIAFTSTRSESVTRPDIYLMNADGGNQSRLTSNEMGNYGPAWSPDGTRLAFVSGRDGLDQIYLMNADGSGQVRLSDGTSTDTDPNWKPAPAPPAPTYSINGQVTASGAGLSGVSIALGGTQSSSAMTNSEGSYSFDNLPTGSYTLTPSLAGYIFNPSSQSFDNLQAGQTANFTATRVYAINGQVTLDGNALAGVTVSVSGSLDTAATTDPTGHFSLTNLPATGNFTVVASKAGYLFNPSSRSLGNLNADQTINFAAATATPPTGVNTGEVSISEFRLRGASGSKDEFIEIYNNTYTSLTVGASDGSGGWALAALNEAGTAATTVFVIPGGTVIPPRAHYLAANGALNGGYSLGAHASADLFYSTDISDDRGIALFKTSNPSNFNLANRLDAVGFNTLTGTLPGTYREGGGLAPVGTTDGQFCFVRKLTTGLPQDTNNNASDFVLVSTGGGTFGSLASVLGAPAPENLKSPVANAAISSTLIDASVPSTSAPNRVRELTPVNNGSQGTLSTRRRFTNNTGQPVTRLHFRVIDITTLNSAGYVPGGAQADVRVLSSTNIVVTTASGQSVAIQGTTLEDGVALGGPPQPVGGGLNSGILLETITLQQPLPPGEGVNVQFLLGVQQKGSFRFFVIIEGLP